MSEVIDDVLAGLVAARQTMQKQTGKIGEIMERSNKTLLHIETQNNLQTTIPHSTTMISPPSDVTVQSQEVFNFKPECEQSIVKILEQFQLLMQQSVDGEGNAGGFSALDNCLAYRQRAEHLGSSVRKLVAFCDSMNKLKLNLQEQQELAEEEDKENIEEDF